MPGFGPPGDSIPPGALAEPTPAGSWLSRHRKPVAFIGAGVILAAAGAGIALSLSSSAAAKTFALSFPAESYPQSGVTVDRTWTLTGGKHPTLHGALVFHTSKPGPAQVEEVLPASLVPNPSDVTFHPQPTVIDPGRVVRYSLPAAAGNTVTNSYDVAVSDRDVSMAALQRWATDQRAAAGDRYRASHQLYTLAFTEQALALHAGESGRVMLNGTMANGEPAATVALSGATFKSVDPAIATVASDGTVRAPPGHHPHQRRSRAADGHDRDLRHRAGSQHRRREPERGAEPAAGEHRARTVGRDLERRRAGGAAGRLAPALDHGRRSGSRRSHRRQRPTERRGQRAGEPAGRRTPE